MAGPIRLANDFSPSAANTLVSLLDDNGIGVDIAEVHATRVRADFAGKQLSYVPRTIEGVWARLDDRTMIGGGFTLALALTAREGEDAPSTFAEVLIRVQLIYTFTESLEQRPDDDLEQFFGYYGFIHMWPFVRAEIQALTAKINVPPLTLPVLKTGRLPTALTVRQIFPSDDQSREQK